MAKNDVQVNFRMPAELKAQLEKEAAENNRSLTSEIVARLEKSLRYDPESDRIELSDKQLRMFTATMLDRMMDAGMLKPGAWEHTGSKPGETASPDSIEPGISGVPLKPSKDGKRRV